MSSEEEEVILSHDDDDDDEDEEDWEEEDCAEEEEDCAEEEIEDSAVIEPQTEVPKDIDFDAVVVGICCHPKRNIVAAGSISGPVTLYSFNAKDPGNQEVISFDHHKKPCRAVRFSEGGEYLFTASQDTTISVLDLETNSVYRKFTRPNGSSLYSILPIDNYLLASGEDDGQVVLWDYRMQTPVQLFEDCEDYISCMVMNQEKKTLLATCGDGTLAVYNIRGKKLEMRSEEFNHDLGCAGIFKFGTKVAVGAGDGSLNIFNWGEFGNISDRFPGHPGSVDSMAVLSDDVICTGCEDGRIRAVQIFPTRFLGVLGTHNGFSVECLSLNHDKTLLASCSYDQKIKFWDLSGIEDLKFADVSETKNRQLTSGQVNDFFSDLA